jgi:hypothetical protein
VKHAGTNVWVAARVRRLVLDRAVKKTLRWIEHRPPADVCLPRDIGLGSVKTERPASHDRLLAADPFHITLKRNVSATKPKSRSQ